MNDIPACILEGAPNFRDIGGYKTTGNMFLKKGIIFRAGELSKLTKQDKIKITQLGIRTIIDIRTPYERKTKPDCISTKGSINFVNIPFYPSKDDLTDWTKFKMI